MLEARAEHACSAANKRGDFVAARRHFRAAFDLSRKPEAAISAANMAAKNGEVQAALDEYDELLRGGGAGALSSVHRSADPLLATVTPAV